MTCGHVRRGRHNERRWIELRKRGVGFEAAYLPAGKAAHWNDHLRVCCLGFGGQRVGRSGAIEDGEL
jgi:hypothetical protein